MLIEDVLIEVKWERRNKQVFTKKGYVFTEIGDTFLVNPKDLSNSSHLFISVKCDYCGKNYEMQMKDYTIRVLNHEYVKKCACEDCKKFKTEEICLIKFGAKSNLMTDETKEKIKKTNIDKYGYENASKNENVKNKKEQTTMERYGAISPTLNEDIRKKQIETNIEKYGNETPLQNKDVKEKTRKALFSKHKAPTSRTQEYLCELLNGTINFPLGKYSIDIVLSDMIALEYDGGGHDLQVKFGNVTKEEFEQKERKRDYFLKRRGFKIIRLVSKRDKLPNNLLIIELINKCKNYMDDGGSTAEINIDEKFIRLGKNVYPYDFGNCVRKDKEYFERTTPTN
jgi:very-short-patch-repair endonuclease